MHIFINKVNATKVDGVLAHEDIVISCYTDGQSSVNTTLTLVTNISMQLNTTYTLNGFRDVTLRKRFSDFDVDFQVSCLTTGESEVQTISKTLTFDVVGKLSGDTINFAFFGDLRPFKIFATTSL